MNVRVASVAIAALCAPAIALGQGAPDPRPGPSTPVTVMNTPLPVTGTVTGNVNATVTGNVNATIVGTPQVKIASNQVAFAKRFCFGTIPNVCVPAAPESFTVPAITAGGQTVKELVIDFVSGICVGSARTTFVRIRAIDGPEIVADTGDNYSFNYIPVSVAQFASELGQNSSQALAEQTRITFVPGMLVDFSLDFAKAGEMACRVQLNGHFVTA